MNDAKVSATKYGFQFGPALVERLASHKGYVIVGIKTEKQTLEVTVTPTGLLRLKMPKTGKKK